VFARIVAVAFEVTVEVAMPNVADALPAGTVTDADTVAVALLLDRCTTVSTPTVDARVTSPVLLAPPCNVDGFNVTVFTGTAVTVSFVVFEPPKLAVIVAVALDATAWEVTVTAAELAPAGTITAAGTMTALLLLARATGVSTAATPFNVAVRVAFPPPTTVDVETETKASDGVLTMRPTDFAPPVVPALIVADTFAATGLVVMGKLTEPEPARTVIEAGTDTDGSLDVRLTGVSTAATAESATVPVRDPPPTTLAADRLIVLTAKGVTVMPANTWLECSSALIVVLLLAPTPCVVTLNAAEVWPDGTTTEPETAATAVLPLTRVTVSSMGAGPLSVTVPLVTTPPCGLGLARVTDATTAVSMLNDIVSTVSVLPA